MVRSRWERLAPLTGVLTVVLTIVGLIVYGSAPDFIDKPQKIADYYVDNSGRVIVASYIGILGTVVFIWFVGVLRSRLRLAEGAEGRLSAIAFAGGIAASAPFFLVDMFNAAAGFRADEDGTIDPNVAATLSDLSGISVQVAGIAVAVLVLATGALALRTGVLPRWLGIASVVLGIALLSPIAYVALAVFGIWLIVVAVLLYMRPEVPAVPGAAQLGRTPA